MSAQLGPYPIRIAPDFLYSHLLTPNDPHFSAYQAWHYNALNLPAAWNITTGSTSVIVAVVDTGVVLNHPDFAGRLIAGYDFIFDPLMALDGDGIDNNPDDPGDNPGQGSSFHGTHVAGTIGAASNNGVGGAGVDWNCKLMPIRVLGNGGGSSSDIAQGIRYAAGLTNMSGTLPANRADVINMSLGGPGFTTVIANAITAASNAGCTLIAAAGNDYEQGNLVNYPASYPEVIAVGATNPNYARAKYSNTASGTTVCAPGGQVTSPFNTQGGVLSTWRDDTVTPAVNKYQWLQGTSMAAPHVAGVAALMLAVNSSLTPTDIRNILTSTALDLGATGYDAEYGYGLIRAEAALIAAGGTLPANPPTAAVTNTTVLVPAGATTTYTSVVNVGGGALNVSNPQAFHFGTESWLGVSLQQNGTQVLVVLSINQAQLTAGNLYYALATVDTNDTSAPIVAINVLVNKLTTKAVTYQVRVRAVDIATGLVEGEVFTDASSSFNYTLPGLDPADYVIGGFVDRDSSSSLTIDDLVGVYPSLTVPNSVTVTAGATSTGISFPLERHTVGILATGSAQAVP
ncbi:MAG: S8 family peptidase [Planctomycetes bacterium]|nr:S8 family peptidase [Planctomycetota bacterium]